MPRPETGGFADMGATMQPRDRAEFLAALRCVYALYRADLSEGVIGIWWTAMQQFDLPAVKEALGRHAMNPDVGQFLPKPADVVKMLQGSTQDAALIAWSKFDAGVQRVGTYATVAFDDPLIHVVIEEMGGWIPLGRVSVDEWPFKQQEFVKRYRAYRARSEVPQYPPKLVGIIDAQNAAAGFNSGSDVKLLGDPDRARRVLEGGVDVSRLPVTLARIADKRAA